MKYVRVILICIFSCLLLYFGSHLFIGGLYGSSPTKWRPENGVWYCDELQLQISFEDEYDSFLLIGERNIRCVCENDKGSKEIMVLCQESDLEEYKLGDVVFGGLYIGHDNSTFVVEDSESGEIYTFIRTGP